MKNYALFTVGTIFLSLLFLSGCTSARLQLIGDVTTLEKLFLESNEIVIPKGVYRIDRTLYVPANKRVNARGCTFLLTRKTGLGTLLAMKDVSNVYWNGGVFDCARTNGDNGIAVTMSSNVHISNVEVKNCLQALFPLLGGRGVSFHPGSVDCSLRDATVHDSSVGLDVQSVDEGKNISVTLEDCKISRCGRGIYIQGSISKKPPMKTYSTSTFNNIKLVDCGFEKGVINSDRGVGAKLTNIIVVNTKRKATALFRGVPYNFLIDGLIWKTKSTETVFDFSWGGEQVLAITPEGFGFTTRELTIKTKTDDVSAPLIKADTRNRIKQLNLSIYWDGPLGKIIKNSVLEDTEAKRGVGKTGSFLMAKGEVYYTKEKF